jgi:sugar-specific transcriptional regulator TrmB
MLVSKEGAIQILTDLGLTLSQARIYFALSKSGVSTAKTISQISQVAREHVYEVMPQLQDLGLVEKIIDVPSKFRALPIQEGLQLLLQRRARKTRELQGQTMEIIRGYKKNILEMVSREEDNQFILIPRKEAVINRRKKEIEAAQTSIDSLVSFKRLSPTLNMYHEVAKKALERGVKIRVITEKPENENEIPEIVQDLKKNPSFEFRNILNSPLAVVTIYDRKTMLVTTSPLQGLGESPALWSNNPSLIAMINDFFEILWITAMEKPTKED